MASACSSWSMYVNASPAAGGFWNVIAFHHLPRDVCFMRIVSAVTPRKICVCVCVCVCVTIKQKRLD